MFRGKTLISCVYILFHGLLNNRLQSWCEVQNKLSDEQNGFKPDRNIVDHLFSVYNVVETSKLNRLSIFVVSTDCHKVCDRISWRYC